MFLIRNSLTNVYDSHLKKLMENANKGEILSPNFFKRIIEE
jgi:hypothetical protein